jgi:hypothetical protein
MSDLDRRQLLRRLLGLAPAGVVVVARAVLQANAASAGAPPAGDVQERADRLTAAEPPTAEDGREPVLFLNSGWRNGGGWRNAGFNNTGWRNSVGWQNGNWKNGAWTNGAWKNGGWGNTAWRKY